MAKNAIFHRSKDILSRKNSDGSLTIIKLSEFDFYYEISGKAVHVWNSFDGRTPLARICEDLADKDMDKETLVEFSQDLLKDLKKFGLVEVVNKKS